MRMALALVTGSRVTRANDPRDTTGETAPRKYLFDEMFSPRYDETILEEAPEAIRRIRPRWLQLAFELHRRRSEYDVIVTWGERLSLAMIAVQWFASDPKPHVPMMYWFSKPNVAWPMRAFGSSVRSIVTWSSVQRTWAIDRLGYPPERIHLVKHFVDQLFWRPRDAEIDTVCAVGSEMRDYGTLVDALAGTGLPCHIATPEVRVNAGPLGARRSGLDAWRQRGGSSVTIGPLSPTELRGLYARSRFVVVPLIPTDTDNGVTVILEAMAMSKPVICTRTPGQVDVIQEGRTGILVPPHDPLALREAMLELWHDPDRAVLMGARAREYIEAHHSLDSFCSDVRRAIEASVMGSAFQEPPTDPGMSASPG